MAWKPVPGVFVLALRPDLARPLLDVLIGREKIEPSLGDRAVCDAYLRGARARWDRNADRRAVVDVTGLLAEELHGANLEPHCVENQLGGRRVDPLDVEYGYAAHRFARHVELELQCDVTDREGARALVDACSAGQCEGAWTAEHCRAAPSVEGRHGDRV